MTNTSLVLVDHGYNVHVDNYKLPRHIFTSRLSHQSRTYITILRFRAGRKARDWLVLLSPGSILPSHWLHLPPLGPNLLPCGLARPCKAMQGKGFMQNKWQKHSFRVEFISLHFQESFVLCRHLTFNSFPIVVPTRRHHICQMFNISIFSKIWKFNRETA